LREAFIKEGLRGIYKGALISIMGVTLFRSTYFGIFDTFKEKTHGSLERWFVSYLASLAAIFVTYPSDTIRRRLMITSRVQNRYAGFLDCATKIWKEEGFKSYFRGAPVIFFQGATSATIYFIFDKIIKDVKKLR
jgi:solute carrier family 25 (adenine nucleotide translocator) protein 4/5/6/31